MATKKFSQTETILTLHQKRVLDWVAQEEYFYRKFYLTGGTALAEFYLKHRFSEDLDFFSEKEEVNIRAVTQKVEQNLKQLRIEKFDTRNVFGLWTFFFHFFDGEQLKVDFSYYPFPRIEKRVKYKNMEVDSPYDIAVNKVHTIAMKPRARDFLDIYFLIKEYHYDFADLLLRAKAKFDWDVTAVQLGTQLLQAAQASDYPRMLKPIDHKEWQNFFVQEAKRLKGEIFK